MGEKKIILKKRDTVIGFCALFSCIGLFIVALVAAILCTTYLPDVYEIEANENEGFLGNAMKGWCMYGYWRKLKGLVPYSLGFHHIKLKDVMPEENTVNLTGLDEILEKYKNIQMQVVVRLVLDSPPYPYKDYLPDFILKKVDVYEYDYHGQMGMYSPNYNDEFLLSQLELLWKKMGERFDGDPRIAYLELGTYGHWGEFHTYFVKNATQSAKEETIDRIMDMQLKNFKKTMCEVRYCQNRTMNRGIGFYNDMFTSKDHDVYMKKGLETYDGLDRWKTYSFGGEDCPELQSTLFINDTMLQVYLDSLNYYHASWLTSSKFFEKDEQWIKDNPDWMRRRNYAERKMGYNYFVKKGKISYSRDNIKVTLKLGNKGVAPFYYSWPVHFAIVEIGANNTVDVLREDICDIKDCDMKGILPGEEREWFYEFKDIDKSLRRKLVGVKIPSGMGLNALLSNDEQREDGWMIIQPKKYYYAS